MNWISKLYNRLLAISSERWFFFSLGLILTAFAVIVWHIEWAPILPIFVCLIHAFFRAFTGKEGFLWKDYVAALIGAAIVWVMTLI